MLYQQSWYLYYLAGALVVYWLLCRSVPVRKWFLLIASLGLLASLQAAFTAALLGWSVGVFLAARYLLQPEAPRRLRVLVVSMLALLGYLAYFKYLPGLLAKLLSSDPETGSLIWLHSGVILPIGLSYFTFKFLHYLINAYRGQLARYELVDFLLYTVFFPIVPAGPIERIENFVGKAELRFQPTHLSYGVQRIAIGAAKKLLLVDTVLVYQVTGPVYEVIAAGRPDLVGLGNVWLFLACSFLYAYLDFSAYTDLAVGTGRLFGFTICENFRFPVLQRNLSEFWKRWHMSLSAWCRDYVYMPVLGRTRRPRLALYASMMTIGAWHFLNFNWLVWGALHATGLVCLMEWQRFARRRFNLRADAGGWVGHAAGMTLTFAFVTWVFAFVCIPGPFAALQTFLFAVTGRTLL